jgi:hypothetical protein
MTLHLRAHLRALDAPAPSGTSVGSMTVQIGQESVRLPLETTYQINQPDIFWRLARTRLF